MADIQIHWSRGPHDSPGIEGLEGITREYLSQDINIRSAVIRCLPPGRSGAIPLTATLTGENIAGLVPLQPEFIKLVRDDSEVIRFRDLASGTALVFGQQLARTPYLDFGSGMTVFGFKLFEGGDDMTSFSAVAHQDPARALRALGSFCKRLQDWYGSQQLLGSIEVRTLDSRVADRLEQLRKLSPGTAESVERALVKLSAATPSALLGRIHGDLHLDNILIPRGADFCHLIDFANASASGSPCIDVARLESDIVYRLLPYDLQPDDIRDFERNLWEGSFDILRRHTAGHLIASLRQLDVLKSANAAIWLLVGRILNALKMSANTWLQVRPYKYPIRTRGVIASLKILSETLIETIDGRHIHLFPTADGKSKFASDAARSVRWMFGQRQYSDALEFSAELNEADSEGAPEPLLIGSLAGLSTPKPGDLPEKMFLNAAPRVRTPLARGLKALYEGAALVRRERQRDPHKALSRFAKAQQYFMESEDDFFRSVTFDQMARCQLEAAEADAAKISFREAIELKRKTGDGVGLGLSIGGLALVELSTGHYEDAKQLLEEDLSLAQSAADVGAEVKIWNWLGQAILLHSLDIIGSVTCLLHSLRLARELARTSSDSKNARTYSPSLDLAFGYISLGFTYGFSRAPQKAEECSEAAAAELVGAEGRAAEFASTLLEIESAFTLILTGNVRRASVRATGALSHLRTLSAPDFCDYSVRTSKFCAMNGQAAFASQIANTALPDIRKLKLSKLHADILLYLGKS